MLTLILLFIYFVSFLDKPLSGEPCLSPRAQEQRVKWNIPIDELDYPVHAAYLDSLRHMGATIHHTSRWFNGATVEMSESLAAQVSGLGFVTDVETTRDNSPRGNFYVKRRYMPSAVTAQQSGNYTDAQLEVYNLQTLHEAGFEGQGILMTVCDGGFTNANTMDGLRQEQELGHFDFTDDSDGFYGWTGVHGTECLSTISGITEGFYGAATRANYYLMRSEENDTESPKEMDNLVAALEKSDSLGVNVFSVSLGYFMFDNSAWDLDKNNDLDGQTTRASRAATIAARKGMLVCAAAGNEGNDTWRTIDAPSDADSILTVGAVDVDSIVGDFSSYGPSSDGRIKPEVCAVGVRATMINPSGEIVRNNGTSFATPLMAGLAACLWSALPDENAMQIRARIIRSAHRYAHPDRRNQIGYGIPDAWKAYTMTNPMEGLEEPTAEEPCRKVLQNGQILLIREGRIYDIMGRQIE